MVAVFQFRIFHPSLYYLKHIKIWFYFFTLMRGCGTRSLTVRKEHRLRVFEKRVLRRIFRTKSVETAGGWRKLHNEEIHNFYVSPHIITVIKSRRMKWAGHVARMEEVRSAYVIWVGKPERKIPFGKHRHRWKSNIKINLKEMRSDDVEWIHLAQDMAQWLTLKKTVMIIS
jgi:hypothetical protein